MKIEVFAIGLIKTNCYLIENEDSGETVVVDPAVASENIMSHVREMNLAPAAVLLTHAHFDHIMGIDDWVNGFGVPVYIHKDDVRMLGDQELNMSASYRRNYSFTGAVPVDDGDIVSAAGFSFRVIHTPGHSAGSCCYYEEKEKILMSGDTLFYHSVGRTDLPTGSDKDMEKSVKEKLFALPEDVTVYPGHGPKTDIAGEKRGLKWH